MKHKAFFLSVFACLILLGNLAATGRDGHRRPWRYRQLQSVPQRMVSILPSLTESVCELGHCAPGGVDRYSNYPESVQKLPKVGGGIDPNVEAIVALRPDVVLAAKSSRVAERLEALGIKVVVLEPKSHADVQRVFAQTGAIAGSGRRPARMACH